jgi:hypothetical protein
MMVLYRLGIFLLMLKELKNHNFEAFGGQWSIGPTSHHLASGKSPKFLT